MFVWILLKVYEKSQTRFLLWGINSMGVFLYYICLIGLKCILLWRLMYVRNKRKKMWLTGNFGLFFGSPFLESFDTCLLSLSKSKQRFFRCFIITSAEFLQLFGVRFRFDILKSPGSDSPYKLQSKPTLCQFPLPKR